MGLVKKRGLFYILDMFISGTLKHISGANIKSSVWQERMLTSNRSHMIYVRYNLFVAMENCSKDFRKKTMFVLEISCCIFILRGLFVNHYNQSIYQKVSGRIQINLDKGQRRCYFLPFPDFISTIIITITIISP